MPPAGWVPPPGGPPGWRPGYPGQPGYPGIPSPGPITAGRAARNRRTFVIVGIAVAVLVIAGVAAAVAGVGGSPSNPASGSSAITPNQGATIFTDNFLDPSSGWTTTTLASGTSFAYTPQGYVVVAKGSLDHFSPAPYADLVQQLSASATGAQSKGAPAGAGFGVVCERGTGGVQIRYEFTLSTDGSWTIERRRGAPSDNKAPSVIGQGQATAPGSSPVTIEGVCATLPGDTTTRLVLFVNGGKVADLSDTVGSLPTDGWHSGLIVSSDASRPSTVTFTNFVVRRLKS